MLSYPVLGMNGSFPKNKSKPAGISEDAFHLELVISIHEPVVLFNPQAINFLLRMRGQ